VHCERIEEKMGLHGSPTCVMRFDAASGWIVGTPGKGLNAMFVMMNAARLHVALQGIGLLEAAWQKADAYSQERRQMRAPGRGKSVADQADLIADHPAIRRVLATQRAWIDGGRVLAYRTALELDLLKHHPDAARREAAQIWCTLVTPAMKSAFTHQAFHGGSDCLQVFGGHGYVREWGIEQIVRDARVAMIYEGTNEIQAIDLLVRKVLPDGGASLATMLSALCAELDADGIAHPALRAQVDALCAVTASLVTTAKDQPELPYWVAEDFLRAVVMVLLAWAWHKIEAGAADGFEGDAARWSTPAQALRAWVLPEFEMRMGIIAAQLQKPAA
jgi:hypothetical protein